MIANKDWVKDLLKKTLRTKADSSTIDNMVDMCYLPNNLIKGVVSGLWTSSKCGDYSASNTRARTTTVINVKPSTTYTLNIKTNSNKVMRGAVVCYSAMGENNVSDSGWQNVPYTFTTPVTSNYCTVVFSTADSIGYPETYIDYALLEEGIHVPSNTELSSVLTDIGQSGFYSKNLLNPNLNNLNNITVNGVTCTKNSDGTYTLNGTATDTGTFDLTTWNVVSFPSGHYKLVGCPSGGSSSTYYMDTFVGNSGDYGTRYADTGNGVSFNNGEVKAIRIVFVNGTTFSNKVFKPMITTDLSATYSDYTPYVPSNSALQSGKVDKTWKSFSARYGTNSGWDYIPSDASDGYMIVQYVKDGNILMSKWDIPITYLQTDNINTSHRVTIPIGRPLNLYAEILVSAGNDGKVGASLRMIGNSSGEISSDTTNMKSQVFYR